MSIALRTTITHPDFLLAIDCELPSRGVTGIFGPSGCGKTSLLRSIAGLAGTDPVSCRIDDTVWQDATSCVPVHRRGVAYVFQEPSLFPHLDVTGNLDYALRRCPTPRLGIDEVCDLLGIDALRQRQVRELSGGERQRVAIARALLAAPRLLLMDEPLAALDQASKAAILPYLDRLCRELALPIIYVSHDLGEIARLADHLLLLDRQGREGRVLANGPVNAVLTDLDLPLAGRPDGCAVIAAPVISQCKEFHLSTLHFADSELVVPSADEQVGEHRRLRILARDVSLAVDPPGRSSIRNQIPATVTGLRQVTPAQTVVQLTANDTALLCKLTRKSVVDLGLTVGSTVLAQVKSVDLL